MPLSHSGGFEVPTNHARTAAAAQEKRRQVMDLTA
jgi:hypothetical protein